jgi:cyclin T
MSGAGPSASGEQAESESPWLLDDHTVSNTPSRGWFQQKCGGDELAARRKEDEYRKLTCAFIQDTGRALRMCARPEPARERIPPPLRLCRPRARAACAIRCARARAELPAERAARRPQLTIASAMVFYHRFFAFKSYEHFDRFNIATTALFLASKTEETPRKLKDVVAEAFKCQYKGAPPPEAESRELHERKEKVLIAERILLQTLGFDLSLEHPYRSASATPQPTARSTPDFAPRRGPRASLRALRPPLAEPARRC